MPLDWSPFVSFIDRSQCLLLTTHVRPDGDGLGSMLALADTLEMRGKKVFTVVASALVARYDFLDPAGRLARFTLPGDQYTAADGILVLDTGTWNQLGDFGSYLRECKTPRMVIDHHITQDDLGGMRLVDTTAEATGRLIAEAIEALGEKPSPTAAHALFVALAMDTGWFRHPNTTSATYCLASRLVEAGARPTDAYQKLFEQNSLGRIHLMSRVLGRIQLLEQGQIAYTEILRDDYTAVGATPQDSEDLINWTRSIDSVEVGLIFMEQPAGGIKVSFRSRSRIDVARIAQQFGGGGHRLASGATLDLPLDEAKQTILHTISAALRS